MNAMTWPAVAIAAATIGGATAADHRQELATAAAALVQDVRSRVPDDVWDRAHCVIVVPGPIKAAASRSGGGDRKGVMSCRAGDRWTAPLFLSLANRSGAVKFDGEQGDLVLLVMNEAGVDKLLRNRIALGVDAAVAAGPASGTSTGTDAALRAEMLSYSRSNGVFAGFDLSGVLLGADEAANRSAYGAVTSPRRILAMREISAPPDATPFIRALGGGRTQASVAPASSQTADRVRPGGSGAAAGSDDLRARLLEIQQVIDRLLSEAPPSPIGTAGSVDAAAGAGAITIDRARLIQLRQQIDDVMKRVK